MYDDFDTQQQIDEWPQPPEEISPEEYDKWFAHYIISDGILKNE